MLLLGNMLETIAGGDVGKDCEPGLSGKRAHHLPGIDPMDRITQPVSDWWRAFSLLVSEFFQTMGPREYSYVLVVVGVLGFLFLKGGGHRP